MRTIDDLQAVFVDLERTATDFELRVEGGSTRKASAASGQRRRISALVAATVLGIGVVAFGLLMLGRNSGPSTPAATVPAHCDTGPVVVMPDGKAVQGQREADVAATCSYAHVYPVGGFTPSSVANSVRITIAGHDGLFGLLPAITSAITNGPGAVPSVAWQLEPNQWIVLQGTSPDLQTKGIEVQLANVADQIQHASVSPTQEPASS